MFDWTEKEQLATLNIKLIFFHFHRVFVLIDIFKVQFNTWKHNKVQDNFETDINKTLKKNIS